MNKLVEKFLKRSRKIVRDWCAGNISITDAGNQILFLVPNIDDYWLNSTKEYATELSSNKLSSDSQKSIWRMLVLTMQDYAVDSGWESANKVLYCVYEPKNKNEAAASDAYSVAIKTDNGNVAINTGNLKLKKALEEAINSFSFDIHNEEYLEKLVAEIPEEINGFKRLSLKLEKHIAQPWCSDVW